jgi:hypothetical protein
VSKFIPRTKSDIEAWLTDALREYDDPADVVVSVLPQPEGVIVAVRGGDRFLLKVEKVEP